MTKPQVSVLLHTASRDDFLAEHGIPSYFAALCHNLKRQMVTGAPTFELVYCDANWGRHCGHHAALITELPFCVKHVPVHKDHRYWYDKGYVFIAAAKNSTILYADGELCVTFDDAEFFPDGLLARYWDSYRTGRLLGSLHKRLRNIVIDGTGVVTGDEYINDHRWAKYMVYDQLLHDDGNLMFAGTSFGLEDALALNGFDEQFDSTKALEDIDFGYRLVRYGRRFCFDRAAYLWILDHTSYTKYETLANTEELGPEATGYRPGKEETVKNLIAVENYGLVAAHAELNQIVVNREPPTDRHMVVIRRETQKYRGFDPLCEQNAANLALWMAVPKFDLRQQRLELRQAADWRWER